MALLHEQYAPTIIQLANDAVTTGEPINRPIWWVSPDDEEAYAIDSGILIFNWVDASSNV